MRFRRKRSQRIYAMLNITPLVDVVFLLLLFFMLGATFDVRTSIPVQAVRAHGEPVYDEKDLLVTLTYVSGAPGKEAAIYVNDEPVANVADLSKVLAEARVEHPALRVLIRPDARVPSARLIEILGAAREIGIERCSIAAEPIAPGK